MVNIPSPHTGRSILFQSQSQDSERWQAAHSAHERRTIRFNNYLAKIQEDSPILIEYWIHIEAYVTPITNKNFAIAATAEDVKELRRSFLEKECGIIFTRIFYDKNETIRVAAETYLNTIPVEKRIDLLVNIALGKMCSEEELKENTEQTSSEPIQPITYYKAWADMLNDAKEKSRINSKPAKNSLWQRIKDILLMVWQFIKSCYEHLTFSGIRKIKIRPLDNGYTLA